MPRFQVVPNRTRETGLKNIDLSPDPVLARKAGGFPPIEKRSPPPAPSDLGAPRQPIAIIVGSIWSISVPDQFAVLGVNAIWRDSLPHSTSSAVGIP